MDPRTALVAEILSDYRAGKLKVPSLPEVPIKIRNAIRNENVTVSRIAKMVQLDPALSGRLIQVANSPLLRKPTPAKDCHGAIVQLGIRTIQNLVTSFAVSQVFRTDSMVSRDSMRQALQQSCEVAAISYVLARVVRGLSPDRALLGGLVHNIGALPVLRYASKYPGIGRDRSALKEEVRQLSPVLGKMVLTKWSFDDEFVPIPKHIEDWNFAPGEPAGYIDLVIVARAHSLFGGPESYSGPLLPEIASFKKLPLAKLGVGASIELLHQAQEEIGELVRTLSRAG